MELIKIEKEERGYILSCEDGDTRKIYKEDEFEEMIKEVEEVIKKGSQKKQVGFASE